MPFTGPWKSLALGQNDCQSGLLGSTECMGSVTWLCFCVSFFPCPWLPSSIPHEACRIFLNGGHRNSPVINKKRSLRTVGFKHTHTMDPTHMHAACRTNACWPISTGARLTQPEKRSLTTHFCKFVLSCGAANRSKHRRGEPMWRVGVELQLLILLHLERWRGFVGHL